MMMNKKMKMKMRKKEMEIGFLMVRLMMRYRSTVPATVVKSTYQRNTSRLSTGTGWCAATRTTSSCIYHRQFAKPDSIATSSVYSTCWTVYSGEQINASNIHQINTLISARSQRVVQQKLGLAFPEEADEAELKYSATR